MAVTNVDVTTCYNMSLKDFEHSGIHDLFKVCMLFLFPSLSHLFSKVDIIFALTKTLI